MSTDFGCRLSCVRVCVCWHSWTVGRAVLHTIEQQKSAASSVVCTCIMYSSLHLNVIGPCSSVGCTQQPKGTHPHAAHLLRCVLIRCSCGCLVCCCVICVLPQV